MNDLKMLLTSTVGLFKTEFTLYTFTFSFWQVLFWSVVVGLLIWFLKEILS